MSLKIPNEGEIEMLKLIIADAANWRVKLYKDPHTPSDTDTTADYTEANFSGYSGNQPPAGWDVPTTQNEVAQSTATALNFTHNGGGTANTIYGYYVVNTAGKLLWAEEFMMPVTLQAMGDKITLTPNLTLSTQW